MQSLIQRLAQGTALLFISCVLSSCIRSGLVDRNSLPTAEQKSAASDTTSAVGSATPSRVGSRLFDLFPGAGLQAVAEATALLPPIEAGPETPPFKVIALFTLTNTQGKTMEGSWHVVAAGSDRWSTVLTLPGYQTGRGRDQAGGWTLELGENLRKLGQFARDVLEFPRVLREIQTRSIPLIRCAPHQGSCPGREDMPGDLTPMRHCFQVADKSERVFCFEPTMGYVVQERQGKRWCSFRKYQDAAGFSYPEKIVCSVGDRSFMRAEVTMYSLQASEAEAAIEVPLGARYVRGPLAEERGLMDRSTGSP